MLADIWTVAWKDWQEMLRLGGSVRSGALRLLLLPAIMGIFVPLQTGGDWVARPEALLGNAYLPAFIALSIVADSFAGERERHTLETLLASRLSERAILLGKVAAVVSLAWGLTLLTLALALVTVNATRGQGPLVLYSPLLALAAVGLSFLEALAAAGAGVLVSLRAPTVRHAQQTLTFAYLGVTVLVYAPFLLWYLSPPLRQVRLLRTILASAGPAEVAIAAALALAALSAALLGAAFARFRRARLILD